MGYVRDRKDGIVEFCIRSNKDISTILTNLQPHLKIKKPQADLLLEILKKHKDIKTDLEFIEVCKQIDKFSILNDSKKRTN